MRDLHAVVQIWMSFFSPIPLANLDVECIDFPFTDTAPFVIEESSGQKFHWKGTCGGQQLDGSGLCVTHPLPLPRCVHICTKLVLFCTTLTLTALFKSSLFSRSIAFLSTCETGWPVTKCVVCVPGLRLLLRHIFRASSSGFRLHAAVERVKSFYSSHGVVFTQPSPPGGCLSRFVTFCLCLTLFLTPLS